MASPNQISALWMIVFGFHLLKPFSAYVIHGNENKDISVTPSFTNLSCIHGKPNSEGCKCLPCWYGDSCDVYVDNYAPRFLVHRATAVVPTNVTGSVYRAWSSDEDLGLTCPLGPGDSARCPCATVTYQLFASPGDHRFTLDPDTGILYRNPEAELKPGETYFYKIMVQSPPIKGYTQELLYDLLDLEIFVGSSNIKKVPWT